VGVETAVLTHGVPREQAADLARDLAETARRAGSQAAFIGLVAGVPTVGLTDAELRLLLEQPSPPKANTSNLGWFIHQGAHAATTVSTTLELAASAGLTVCATGGLGGVHKNLARRIDISADLGALTRFPVALVTSGCKSILDVESTRELLETLGVTVVGYRTDRFPAFYRRESDADVDARIDDARALAAFVRRELSRTGRAIVIANPIPADAELAQEDLQAWLSQAQAEARATGRQVTPEILGRLHQASHFATVRANVALIRSNVSLAAELASWWSRSV
jgi:pseudouridine-5'-phosphate glycosidase